MSKRTISQTNFPLQWQAAKRRRLASMQGKQTTAAAVTKVLKRRADKRLCTFHSNTPVTETGGVFNLLSNLARGDNSLNQFGGEFVDWELLRMRWKATVASADATDVVRMVVFQWHSAGTPTVGNILDRTGGVSSVIAPYFWSTRKLYTILWDETVALNLNGEACVTGEAFVGSKRTRKTFLAADTAVPQTGGLWYLVVSDSAVLPNPEVQMGFSGIFTDEF